MITRRLSTLALGVAMLTPAYSQHFANVHFYDYSTPWTMPMQIEDISQLDFSDDEKTMYVHFPEGHDISLQTAHVDSITFDTAVEEEEAHDPYAVYSMYIYTEGQEEIVSKEDYLNCEIFVNGKGCYANKTLSGRIRGRGNSTWEWYNKKPYRIKLDSKSKILGVDKGKDWVLLANYRDMTDMMNTFVFSAAHRMGMPHTNHTRYVELFVNGEYKGVYVLTEQIKVADGRVDIDRDEGVLLSFDMDDGPELSPYSGDNFYSSVYKLPVCVKYPEDLTDEQLSSIRDDFAILENAIKARDYTMVDSLMDIQSFITMLQLQEYVYNVELAAPRSMYMYRDKDGKYTWGPVWDFDAGYDFDWSTMMTGHNFFTSYKETLFGSDPYHQNGDYDLNKFFTDMFGSPEFVKQYKSAWNVAAFSIYRDNWDECMKYYASLSDGPMKRDAKRWPIYGKSFDTEVEKMSQWLSQRLTYITSIINQYPTPTEPVTPTDTKLVGTIKKAVTMKYSSGYSQSTGVSVSRDELAALLGVKASTLSISNLSLQPLDADGEVGDNTASGRYGAWWDAEGYTASWGSDEVHVYIESDDLFDWSCGLRNDWGYCSRGDRHTVTMQYVYTEGKVQKMVNVEVTFTIN